VGFVFEFFEELFGQLELAKKIMNVGACMFFEGPLGSGFRGRCEFDDFSGCFEEDGVEVKFAPRTRFP